MSRDKLLEGIRRRESTRALFYCGDCGTVVSLVRDQLRSPEVAEWSYRTTCKATRLYGDDGHSSECGGTLHPVTEIPVENRSQE